MKKRVKLLVPEASRNMHLPDVVVSADLKEVGTPTGGTRRCNLTGCTGTRIAVRWEDGQLTYPCTKGLDQTDPSKWRIIDHMTTEKRQFYQARYIPDFSIVRLPDGRIGWITGRTTTQGHALVHVDRNLAAQVKLSEQLELVKWGAQLAWDELERMEVEDV